MGVWVSVGLCCVCALCSPGTLNFFHLDSFQLGQRGLVQLGSSRSNQRSMQCEGEVVVGQRAEEISFPSLGLACVYIFGFVLV